MKSQSRKSEFAKVTAIESGLIRMHTAEDKDIISMGLGYELGLVHRILAAAFDTPRDPRSDAYRAGVRDLLLYKLCDKPLKNPFPAGTAQADAWWAGKDEGLVNHKAHLAAGCPV